MNVVVAFAAGTILGASAAAAVCWHLIRTARAAFRAAEMEEIASKDRCDQLADLLDQNRHLL